MEQCRHRLEFDHAAIAAASGVVSGRWRISDWSLFSGCYDYRDLGVPLAQLIELLNASH
jgi:hypothetical protein